MVREAKKLHNDNYTMHSSNKSRTMWNLINKELGKDKHNFKNTQLVKNDVIITDTKEVANMFNEYYTSGAQNILQNKLPIINSDKTNLSSNQCNSMFLAPGTESERMNIIKNMKSQNHQV